MSYPGSHIFCLITILLLFAVRPCPAQEKKGRWYGNAEFSSGSNFDSEWYDLMTLEKSSRPSRSIGSFDGKIGWRSDKLNVMAVVKGSSTYHLTSFTGIAYKYGQIDTTVSVDLSHKKQIKSDFTVGTELSYIVGPADALTFKLYHKQEHQEPYNATGSAKTGQIRNAQLQEEQGSFMKYSFTPELTWKHHYTERRSNLLTSLSWNYAYDDRCTVWNIMSEEFDPGLHPTDSSEHTYRITPHYIDSDIAMSVKYTEPDFCGARGLDMEFTVNAFRKLDKDDYSGANLIGQHWEDSTRLIESFRYESLIVEPRVRATYSVGQFRFDWLISPQYFSDRLTNSKEDERFDAGRIDFLFDLQSWWTPNEHHDIRVRWVKSIKRADYLQMCWFQRPGVFSNEIRQGNPDLQPTSESRISADYVFKWDRFSSSLEVGYKGNYDKIEQSYHSEVIDGSTYRVYTWINAGQSRTENVKVGLRWSGTVINADASANVNHFNGYSSNGDRSTESNDMEVNAGISAKLPWDILISGKGKYQSAITRVYGSMSSYISCSCIIRKSFKHFHLFVEGRDLLDKPVTIETYSEDGTEGRYEERLNNRRLFLAGLGITF